MVGTGMMSVFPSKRSNQLGVCDGTLSTFQPPHRLNEQETPENFQPPPTPASAYPSCSTLVCKMAPPRPVGRWPMTCSGPRYNFTTVVRTCLRLPSAKVTPTPGEDPAAGCVEIGAEETDKDLTIDRKFDARSLLVVACQSHVAFNGLDRQSLKSILLTRNFYLPGSACPCS